MATDDNAVSEQKKQQSSTDKAAEQNAGADETVTESSNAQAESATEIMAAESDDVVQLKEKLQKAEDKAASHWEEVLRSRAELENTRRRLERDVENAHKYAVEKFLQDLLPVIDSLEMGINAAKETSADIEKVKEGTELTLKMLNDCTQKFGIQPLNPVGESFNPEYHQAMSIAEDDKHPPNTVIAVMQKGYILNGRLVRPAMVVVSKAASGAGQASKEDEAGQTSANESSQEGKK